MEPSTEAPNLLLRQGRRGEAMRRPGGIRVNEEREVYELRALLHKYPGGSVAATGCGRVVRLQRERPCPGTDTAIRSFGTADTRTTSSCCGSDGTSLIVAPRRPSSAEPYTLCLWTIRQPGSIRRRRRTPPDATSRDYARAPSKEWEGA